MKSNPAQGRTLTYIPSFDGTRGFMCILIIMHHLPFAVVRPPFSFVWIFLQCFFVMSGFLITRILLAEKAQNDTHFGVYIKRFYAKRAFRIFPLYFAYVLFWIVIVALFGDNKFLRSEALYITQEMRQYGWMYLTYTNNFKELAAFEPGQPFIEAPIFSHLWSLAVEEQFYLIIPFLVFFLKESQLKKLVIAVIILVPVFRTIMVPVLIKWGMDPVWLGITVYRNTFSQIDSLFFGVAAAVFNVDFVKKPVRAFLFVFIMWLSATIGNAALSAFKEGSSIWHELMEFTFMTKNYVYIYIFSLANLMSFYFLLVMISGPSSLKSFFEHRILVFLGKITYGMYIYHYIVFLAVLMVSSVFISKFKLDAQAPLVGICIGIISLLTTVLVAHLSYKYFESYFLKLKHRLR